MSDRDRIIATHLRKVADLLDPASSVSELGYAIGLPFTPDQVDLITGGEPAAADIEAEMNAAIDRHVLLDLSSTKAHGPVWQDRNPRPPGQPARCRCGQDTCGEAS